MAEVHIVGQLLYGEQFYPYDSLFCRWSLQTGGAWRLLQGVREGQTQVDIPESGKPAVWSHPIDVHYATKGLQGWPKIHVQVYHQDTFGRSHLVAYGFSHLPTAPGEHLVEVATWQPSGSLRDTISQFFIGGSHQLRNPDLYVSSTDRYRLTTTAMGKVRLRLGVVLRNFSKFGVEF